MAVLQQDETLSASTEVRASARQVYDVVCDITRMGEWSPETFRAQWLAKDRFRAWNRRRLGQCKTDSIVVAQEPDREFSFIVQALGGNWAQWTYLIEPGATNDRVRLTETFRMCVPLPRAALVFEHCILFIRDRRVDLQANLETSVKRIREIVEAGVPA